jgi:hypothetical protein
MAFCSKVNTKDAPEAKPVNAPAVISIPISNGLPLLSNLKKDCALPFPIVNPGSWTTGGVGGVGGVGSFLSFSQEANPEIIIIIENKTRQEEIFVKSIRVEITFFIKMSLIFESK